jgi:hypothetical protein
MAKHQSFSSVHKIRRNLGILSLSPNPTESLTLYRLRHATSRRLYRVLTEVQTGPIYWHLA